MKNQNVNPVFGPILDSIQKPSVFDQLGDILRPDSGEDAAFNRIYKTAKKAKDKGDILLHGYNELIDLLNHPGNIDKQTLMQSIGRTLKKASE